MLVRVLLFFITIDFILWFVLTDFTMVSNERNGFVAHQLSFSSRDGSRTAAISKMERFVIIVNGWKSLTIITKRSILDVTAALDPPQG